MINNIINLLHKTQRNLRIDFNVDFIEYSESYLYWRTGCFYTEDSGETTIRIGKGFTCRERANVLYHELGHSLLWNYRIPKKMLAPFLRDPGSMNVLDSDFKYRFVTNPFYLKIFTPEKHFISPYAAINYEEDFCEVFSEVVAGKCFKKRNESLRQKSKAVKDIISFVQY